MNQDLGIYTYKLTDEGEDVVGELAVVVWEYVVCESVVWDFGGCNLR